MTASLETIQTQWVREDVVEVIDVEENTVQLLGLKKPWVERVWLGSQGKTGLDSV